MFLGEKGWKLCEETPGAPEEDRTPATPLRIQVSAAIFVKTLKTAVSGVKGWNGRRSGGNSSTS